jgi:chromosome segregation ATPase
MPVFPLFTSAKAIQVLLVVAVASSGWVAYLKARADVARKEAEVVQMQASVDKLTAANADLNATVGALRTEHDMAQMALRSLRKEQVAIVNNVQRKVDAVRSMKSTDKDGVAAPVLLSTIEAMGGSK